MTRKGDVEQFLNKFQVKLKVFDVVYIGRDKNAQTLLDMEWVPAERTKVLEQLEVEDYCEGPLEETMHGTGNMWVFGKIISGNEVYILDYSQRNLVLDKAEWKWRRKGTCVP